jgi:hypothetical protein
MDRLKEKKKIILWSSKFKAKKTKEEQRFFNLHKELLKEMGMISLLLLKRLCFRRDRV